MQGSVLSTFAVCAIISLATEQGVSAKQYDGLALPFREVTVSSPVQGQIIEQGASEGDEVKEGDLLTRLFSRVEELQMDRAKAAREKKEFEYKGTQNLFRDKLISEDEMLDRKIELDLASLEYEIAREQFELRRIKAPISGIVVERHAEVGEMVTPNESVYIVVDIEKLYIQFYAKAEDLGSLEVGAAADVVFPDLDTERSFTGKIDFVDPRVDAASGLMRVRVLIDNPDHVVKAGLRAKIALEG
ncbi:efflux RND transporter periplasmic adaptor subunit [Pelagicoccus sp. SDUM812002]|uniref:efflux RND transporter periplasmic adaptor subunit n=1 Tax=Pelagicoccus sp. SDUM812002 TaxID=3041266 RepID=UPI00280DDEED|nr:efflux RND transporter periplasmic adaptor subunit [Pelagicoccus sp. SDUM812002]MDQ8186503.1 efflux RND transporter periplasmic adaptor subunit [Pelagicoccus sp. SDUM812002]